MGGRDQPHLMTQLRDLAAPEMSPGAGFHRHDTARLPTKEFQNLPAPQLLADQRTARPIRSVELKYSLRKIEPDHGNFAHRWRCCVTHAWGVSSPFPVGFRPRE